MLAALFGVLALDRRLQSASAASGNTTSVSFFNVGACPSVQAVKFDFSDGSTGGGVNICPEAFRVVGSPRCQVPGPYGREVFVTLSAHVSYLDITILDPSDDDANLTVPTRVYLAAGQQRNLVGASVRTGTAAAACTNGFHVFSEYAAGPIDQRYFRTVFRHAALDAGGADIVSNGESTVYTVAEGASYVLDQLILAPHDLPTPVSITFATATGGTASLATTRLWGSTCAQTATGFVLFGRPPEIPLEVLRLDGTDSAECVYSEAQTHKFATEIAFYNSVPSADSYTFAFGVSPFLPVAMVNTTGVLGWTHHASYSATTPAEIYVTLLRSDGTVAVRAQRAPVTPQARNLIGVYRDVDGALRLNQLQAGEAGGPSPPPVAPSHFRLVFTHAALTMPSVTVYANDDIELASVPAGATRFVDHPLLPPHSAGRLLKIGFQMSGVVTNTETLLDLSTLCEGAAYNLVLEGTLTQSDLYDPILVTVPGTAQSCSLSAQPIASGDSSSLALVNADASSTHSVRFEWGHSLLSMTRRSIGLTSRQSVLTDVAVGDLFVRLLEPDPPYAPLTAAMRIVIQPQARNALVALRSGDAGGVPTWHISSLAGGQIDASSVRLLMINGMVDVGGAFIDAAATVRGSTSQQLTLPAGGGTATVELPADGGADVTFTRGGGSALVSASLPFGEACAQSLQLMVLSGRVGASGAEAPSAVRIDVANGYCRLVVPTIPPREELAQATTQPPRTTQTLDIFGPGGPGDGGLLPKSAARASARHHTGARGGVAPLLLAAVAVGAHWLLGDGGMRARRLDPQLRP